MVTTRRAAASSAASRVREAQGDDVSSVVTTGKDEAIDQSSSMSAIKPPKKGDFGARLVIGLLLSFFFLLVIKGGHMWVAISVVLVEIGMYREIINMGYEVAKGGKIRLWRTTGWYFFAAAMYLFYGKSVMSHFADQRWAFMQSHAAQYMLKHHTFIAFSLYCAGFVGFVLSLRPGHYAYQFAYFGRALVALLLVVVQSNFMILNVKHGLIWFCLPSILVIVNDTFAYFFGRLFGRHSLTSLSPKKTWEGYLGGALATLVTACFLSGFMASFPSLVCPKYEFSDCNLVCVAQCEPSANFILTHAKWSAFGLLDSPIIIPYYPVQLHAVALGVFASIIAPFGGFFASGAKRAFNKKDFGSLLPGHGGVTDRVDCQLLMAVFTYVYLINFVEIASPDVGKILSFIVELSNAEQVELFNTLYNRLIAKQLVPALNLTTTSSLAGEIYSS